MDINSFVIGFKKGKKSGGGFPGDKYFEGGYTEVVLENATKLRQGAFYQDSIMETLSLPKVTELSSYCVNTCSNLSTILLAEGLAKIPANVFSNCVKLTSLVIPSSVTEVSWNALMACGGLETVTFLGKPTKIGSAFNSTALPNSVKTIYCPWKEGEVPGFPWGATNLENIFYEYSKGE